MNKTYLAENETNLNVICCHSCCCRPCTASQPGSENNRPAWFIFNQIIDPVKTIRKGFGFFPLMPSENARYRLHITSDVGKGQQFSLPSVNSTGLSFSVWKVIKSFSPADVIR